MTFLPLGGNTHRVVTKIVTFLLRILYQITYKSICEYVPRAGVHKTSEECVTIIIWVECSNLKVYHR